MGSPPPSHPFTRVAFSFPADPDSIREVRHLVISEASTLPFTQDELDDIALAVSEAFTNIILYAPGFRVRGACIVDTRQLDIRFEVDNKMSVFLEHQQLPTGLAHGGRGIPMLHMLMPTVEIHERPDGVAELRLVKPVTLGKERS